MSTRTLQCHAATAVSLAGLFWALAAVGVAAARQLLWPASPGTAAVVMIVIIIASASAFAWRMTTDEALFAGVGWAALALLTEMLASAQHPRFALLGPPSRPILRDLVLVTWIFAPAIFSMKQQSVMQRGNGAVPQSPQIEGPAGSVGKDGNAG